MGEVGKTYSKKNPVMKQNVLGTSNGSLSVHKTEAKVNGAVVNGDFKEETVCPPWGRCMASMTECPVHSNIVSRVTWSYYSTSIKRQLADVESRRSKQCKKDGE